MKLKKYISMIVILLTVYNVSAEDINPKIYSQVRANNKTAFFYLSLTSCINCMDSKIKNISQQHTVDKSKIYYVFAESLNSQEKKILEKKYQSKNIFSIEDEDLKNYVDAENHNMFYIYDNHGIQLSKLNLLNGMFDKLSNMVLSKGVGIDDENPFVTAGQINYNKKNNSIVVLDPIQNSGFEYSTETGQMINQIEVPKKYRYYFRNASNSDLYAKYDHFIQSANLSAILLNPYSDQNKLNCIFSADILYIDNISKNGDTSLASLTGKFCAEYSSVGFQKEQILNKSNMYMFYEKILFFDEHKCLGIGTSQDYLENETDSSYVLAAFNGINDKPEKLITSNEISKVSGQKYYSGFDCEYFRNYQNQFAMFNFSNSVVLTFKYENGIKNMSAIKPIGILSEMFSKIQARKLTPQKTIDSPKTTIFHDIYYVYDMLALKDRIVLLSAVNNKDKSFERVVLQSYNYSGEHIEDALIKYQVSDGMTEMKFIRYDSKYLYFLAKWKDKGWMIHKAEYLKSDNL